MSLLDRFKPQPRWKHADPAVRVAAIQALDDAADDTAEVLASLAAEDPDVRVRRTAVSRLLDAAVLGRAARNDSDEAVRMLLRRCCTDEPARVPERWTAEQVAEIDAGLAAMRSDAEISASFTCAGCGHEWQSAVDPAAFLWEELEACAIHLLQAVHRLAAAYGWSEREILALPAHRRETYLAFLEP